MKIYTKVGDTGQTSLIGGTKVSKSHPRLDAYGTIDELNSFLGYVRSLKPKTQIDHWLEQIQHELFNLGSRLACEDDKMRLRLPAIAHTSIDHMESKIDEMTEKLPQLRTFILPGGHPIAAQLHLARTVCRRAERSMVQLNEIEAMDPIMIIYVNRLSDFLFTLARFVNFSENIPDVPWKKP